MGSSKKALVIGAILLLTGCTDFFMICSLNPFYLEKNIILSPEMEGRWSGLPIYSAVYNDANGHDVWTQMDTTAVWTIERVISKETLKTKLGKDSVVFNPLDHYQVRLQSSLNDSTAYQFKMVLFKVDQGIYADFMPSDNTGLGRSRLATESYYKIHTLARIELSGNQCRISWLGAEYMKEMIEKKRVRVNYRWTESANRLLLTGSPEQLTGMIERYAGEPRFIDWENQPAMLKLNRIN